MISRHLPRSVPVTYIPRPSRHGKLLISSARLWGGAGGAGRAPYVTAGAARATRRPGQLALSRAALDESAARKLRRRLRDIAAAVSQNRLYFFIEPCVPVNRIEWCRSAAGPRSAVADVARSFRGRRTRRYVCHVLAHSTLKGARSRPVRQGRARFRPPAS
ncbi:hypothetical protein EVAR_69414_1 [Eumeta japonica]|uniref:Uncharacterized protein n=1 Tax=Eumeta variegata TaxID=151549 RepID=A0A4C1ZAK2_EUMVA|nr:hypothetical protein EVAR_69414_1 [Eumeta japonica]